MNGRFVQRARVARLKERKRKFNLSVKADAALAPIPVSLVASLRARFLSYREERVAPLLPDRCTAGTGSGSKVLKATFAEHLFVLSPLVQSVRANFVLAAASQITGLSAPEYCCISLVALALLGLFFGGSFSLLLEFFCLFIKLVVLLCLSKAGRLGGSRLVRIIVKPLLNVCRQLGKINFGNTPLRLNRNAVRLYPRDRRVFVLFAVNGFEVIGEND